MIRERHHGAGSVVSFLILVGKSRLLVSVEKNYRK